jgi:hypothetical protein
LPNRRAALLDSARMASQFLALERRTSRAGKDSIDHPPGGHDDVANAVAGALTTTASAGAPMFISSEALANARRIPRGRRYADRARRLQFRI